MRKSEIESKLHSLQLNQANEGIEQPGPTEFEEAQVVLSALGISADEQAECLAYYEGLWS